MRRNPRRRNQGNAKLVAVAALAAVSIGAKVAWDMYQSGARDPSYVLFMALAAVIALALVAPQRFSGREDANEEWGGEDEWSRTKRETPMPADPAPPINAENDSAHDR